MTHNSHDDTTVLAEIVEEKCRLISEVPGLEVDFSPSEAELAGAFREDALGEDDAKAASFDEYPYGNNV